MTKPRIQLLGFATVTVSNLPIKSLRHFSGGGDNLIFSLNSYIVRNVAASSDSYFKALY